MSASPVLLWFRFDLRLDDHPALYYAATSGRPVIPVYVWSPHEEAPWEPGGASRWWLHQSLLSLQHQWLSKGNRLIIRQGNTKEELTRLIRETRAGSLYWSRRYEPALIQRDAELKSHFNQHIEVRSFNSALLFEPWEIATRKGEPYPVFTPFWKTCTAKPEPPLPLDIPDTITPPARFPESLQVDDLQLMPSVPWYHEIQNTWTPGAQAAMQQLQAFQPSVTDYPQQRDIPCTAGTSRLSPYLHFGEISPRRIWHEIRESRRTHAPKDPQPAQTYLRELGWREFAHHILFHFPHTPHQPMRNEFARFPWNKNSQALQAWQTGQTGYPLVDAGMRELWATGWMHNRVRMVAASFFLKDLMLPWQEGARWFWDTLVDADLANNTMGWQWSAGCGADAAPYFRIFNPVLQGKKFDPQGEYIRKWIPELSSMPNRWIHHPWDAPEPILNQAGIRLGKNYPYPIVNHAQARGRALEAYRSIRA